MREQGAGQAPSKRIQQLKERLFSEPRCVSIEQARIVTRVYREHPDLPVNILRAKAFATALEEITLRIDPGELIVGNRTAGIRAGVIFPESGLKWVEQEIETLPTRPQDRFEVTQEDIAAFRNEILPFWRGRTLEDVLEAKIGDEMRAIGKVAKINQTDHAQGHICPDTPTWLLLGPRGLAEQARKNGRKQGTPSGFMKACRWRWRRLAGILPAMGRWQKPWPKARTMTRQSCWRLGAFAKTCDRTPGYLP